MTADDGRSACQHKTCLMKANKLGQQCFLQCPHYKQLGVIINPSIYCASTSKTTRLTGVLKSEQVLGPCLVHSLIKNCCLIHEPQLYCVLTF